MLWHFHKHLTPLPLCARSPDANVNARTGALAK